MAEVTIYHNPRCSKSRGALQILQEKFSDDDIEEIRYLENPPSVEKLAEICQLLDVEPLQIIRTGEKLFKELGLSENDACGSWEWLQIMAEHPKLIERPIVLYKHKAVVARPPEKIMEIF